MRFVGPVFVLFSLVFSFQTLGENPPPQAPFKECAFQEGGHPALSWRTQMWEIINPESGVTSIFNKREGAENSIELITDGEEHESPHPAEWSDGSTEVRYRVTSYEQGKYSVVAFGKRRESPWELTYHVETNSETNAVQVEIFLSATPSAATNPAAVIVCKPLEE